jgi:hypothetical protein
MITCSIPEGNTIAGGEVEARLSQGRNHHVLSKQRRDANMYAWWHSARVLSELNALQCQIDRAKSLALANEKAGYIERTFTASTVARCQLTAARRGSQTVVRGLQLSVLVS